MARDHLRSGRFWARAAASFAFRLACYDAMLFMALVAESRAAPSLPDPLIAAVPYVELAARYNYLLWVAAYVPIALVLLARDGERFIRYMVTAGLLALLRGACILATGLGPVHGPDVNAGMDAATRWSAFLRLVTPLGFFDTDAGARVSLTKDLFFSGHTATTFLLLLYVWRWPGLRAVMLFAHLATVATVFLAHLHYSIDVIGAYAVTFSIFVLREGDVKALLSRF
ncbi:MAG: phosphatase PAP2 family protein [Archangiaceae bacterium]|nr:phosphatase PAP2 family protein [Archangiaceae bacterium]